jgi:hypothetical protein
MAFNRNYSSFVILSRLFWILGGLFIVFRSYNSLQQYSLLVDTVTTTNNTLGGAMSGMASRVDITLLITELIGVVIYGAVIIALGFAVQALREITLNSRWQAEIADAMRADNSKQTELLEKLTQK